MTTIEEAWAKVEAERLKYGLAMAREDAETVVKHVDLDRSAVRAAMLQAHSDACTQCLYRSQGAERAECAGYRRIEELGK